MSDALSIAADLGFAVARPPSQEELQNLSTTTGEKGDDLIKVLRELTTVQREIADLQVELQGRKDDKNVAHLTHVSEMEKKIETLARITTILKDVIQNKMAVNLVVLDDRGKFYASVSNFSTFMLMWDSRDLQSYLSDLSLFVALESSKGEKKRKGACSESSLTKSKKIERWFSLIDAATLSRKRGLLPVKKLRNSLFLSNELHRTLYGFIVFEVSWTNVRGINYLNELQTDTYLALEAKIMQRWEFDSIEQAQVVCLCGEIFYDAKENFSRAISIDDEDNICNDSLGVEDISLCCPGGNSSVHHGTMENRTSDPHTPPTGPYKRRKVTMSISAGVEVDFYSNLAQGGTEDLLDNSETYTNDCESTVDAKQYRDVLILFSSEGNCIQFVWTTFGLDRDLGDATTILYPLFWILWEILYAPIRMVLVIASFIALLCAWISELIGDFWRSVSGIFQLASASEATMRTYEVSIWQSLWNDLFSQVFRALRSIFYGFVAFFTACNRHRLRISSKEYSAKPRDHGPQVVDIRPTRARGTQSG
ncbi:hypothetical protein GH714_019081 [Hevea brasiliensis]|uniref:Uncharacterized protein n=1 Tax=Hevea brasiliensis TaxID=3981 RepID=A0A6A6KTJ9_HEVBR|nr:hypothetical protein GH714_019081 [Hevea brasiliensis]